MPDFLFEIVLKVYIWSEDDGSMLGFTLPFWSTPQKKSVSRRLWSIVVWKQTELTHSQPTSESSSY